MTPAMLVTINILDRWADWNTGTVERASAQGISTWCNNTLNKNTVQKALQRLEQQGHVTRDLTLGSHHGYPVVTQNYEAKIRELSRYPDGSIVKGENGQPVCTTRTEVLNPKKVLTWEGGQAGRGCESASRSTRPTGCKVSIEGAPAWAGLTGPSRFR